MAEENHLNVSNGNDESESVPNGKEEFEDESNTMTLGDILKAEEMLEENAEAVLGPGDDNNCTTIEGYKKRQALYSCLTCTPVDSKERAGICLACSYHCHGDHDLVELFTKRNFKCDCGNSLFKGKCCFLDPAKSGINEGNTYNHNFEGKYCTCGRPYPDPEDDVEDEMLQCIVCEDWFHTRHLDGNVPKEYSEMICNICTDKLPFLQYYLGYSVSQVSNNDDGNASTVNITESDNKTPLASPQTKNEHVPIADDSQCENDVSKEKECQLKNLRKMPREKGPTFWPSNFRRLLCSCDLCMEMYKSHNVPFLPDEGDTVQAYEDEGKERRRQQTENGTEPSQNEQGLQQILSSMDRVQQMEAILGYNDLKSNLKDFLTKFAENKKVVREEDIHEFFSGMKDRKRRRVDVPHNCR